MDWSTFNWPYLGFPVIGLIALIFLKFAARRQWSATALLIGILHLPLAMMNAAAPFRGSLDPTYPGYNLGIVHADPGIQVAVFASFILLGSLLAALIAISNRPGGRNMFIVVFDFFVLAITLPPILSNLMTDGVSASRVEFGEYLQFHGLSAFLFENLLITGPYLLGLLWALGRSKASS